MAKSKFKESLRQAFVDEDVDVLAKAFFPHVPAAQDLTETQREMVRVIAFEKHRRVNINAMTRYGKTQCVAIGICLYIAFHQNKKIALIAPQKAQTDILRNYLSELITDSPVMREIVDIRATGVARLKKEASRNRQTFKNGCEYQVFSAAGEANRLMGFGVNGIVVKDESCLIPPEAEAKISRMMGDAPGETMLVQLANPWDRSSQYFKDWRDPRFYNIHVDWKIALKEGRTTREFVEEQRRRISPMEFTVLYESDFPEQAEDALISYSWVERALTLEYSWTPEQVYMGVDPARFGLDKTVVTIVGKKGDEWKVIKTYSWHRKAITETAGKVIDLADRYRPNKIYVDDTGLGGGVTDILKEHAITKTAVCPVVAGNTSMLTKKEKKRFDNISSRNAVRLANLLERGLLALRDDGQVLEQLVQPKVKLVNGKTKVDKDPDDVKSPDFFDSLCLAVSEADKSKKLVFDVLAEG